ncbi:hypothetical protein I3J27_17850 [Bradyrhizobium xenonodulans]|uniref:DUF1127 domain-containing protein n=1 Tax=Bradyrhizobium xenonodulans TaxID=2736875 RepID=A0ABY7MVJ7_9BRAD|nr:hypothetical protein [Bradyrhizobium xenonodulans]WBL82199.1 hypothetical protein I3J27_17850 [Bradyrhizobium xenonodulans]
MTDTAQPRSQALAFGQDGAISPAKDFHLPSLAPLTLFVTWYQRACFRSELLEDLRHRPEYLSDIGICRHEATTETNRFFWEPILLRRSMKTDFPARPPASLGASTIHESRRRA